MKWQVLKADMISANENKLTITATKASKLLGVSRQTFYNKMRGCERVSNSKCFFVHDVAQRWCGGGR